MKSRHWVKNITILVLVCTLSLSCTSAQNSSVSWQQKVIDASKDYSGCDGLKKVVDLIPTDAQGAADLINMHYMTSDDARCTELIKGIANHIQEGLDNKTAARTPTKTPAPTSLPTESRYASTRSQPLNTPIPMAPIVPTTVTAPLTYLVPRLSPTKVPTPTVTPTPVPTPTPDLYALCGPLPSYYYYHEEASMVISASKVCTCESGIWRDCAIPTPTPMPTLAPIKYSGIIQVSTSSNDIGEFINLYGWNFIPNTWVTHFYDIGTEKIKIGSSLVDYSGDFSLQVRVPYRAPQGVKHQIISSSDEVTGTIAHNIKPSKLLLSKQTISKGDILTITGTGLPTDMPLKGISISNISVMKSPIPRTDSDGNFQVDLEVPRVPMGDCIVEVKIGNKSFVSYIFVE